MRHLHYEKPRSEHFQPGYRTNQPSPSRSLNEASEERIVTLYTSGHSIESITREVGRARHLVVHTLQSKGIFGSRRPALHAEELDSERKSDPVPDKRANQAVERAAAPPKKTTRARKPKSPNQLDAVIDEKATAKTPSTERTSSTQRWSPQVVNAMIRVASESGLSLGLSVEEVKRLASGSGHKAVRRG